MAQITTAINPFPEAMKQQRIRDEIELDRDRFLKIMNENPFQGPFSPPAVKPVNKKVLLLTRSK